MKHLSYLALGDSYTIGEQVPLEESFPHQAVAIFNQNSEHYQIETPHIIATTGWTTDELEAGILQANITDKYDLVTLLIGVNNQYRGRPVEAYKGEFEDLLWQAISFANGDKQRVAVLSIPDWGGTPFAAEKGCDAMKVSQEIDEYNKAKKQLCAQHEVSFIDITYSTRIHNQDKDYLVEDLLHYSGKEYRIWADMLAAHWLHHFGKQ